MTLSILSISSVLPAAGATAQNLAGGSKGLFKGLGFGKELDLKLATTTSDGSDVLSQLAGLLQSGTPMATIIDQVAKEVSAALASATNNSGNTSGQRTLARALASALAPPGTSPPTSGTQAAAALEQRLASLLTTVSRELSIAGQQNRISGNVLDAKSAKETPAPQSTQTTDQNASAQSVAFAQSILQKVVSQLQAARGKPASQLAAQLPTVQAVSPLQTQSGTQPAVVQAAVPQNAVPQATVPQSTVQQPVLAQSATLQPQPADTQPTLQVAAQSDVLGRMLARAANADAQRNVASSPSDEVVARQIPRTTNTAVPVNTRAPQSTSGTSPADLFARLIAVIAENSGGQSSSSGDKQSQEFSLLQNAAPAAHDILTSQAATPAFATALTSASASATHSPSVTQPYTAVDPQSVLDQLVNGIVMRNSGATSEVRMRLQPEHLGDLSVKLTVSGNSITANVTAQNADVRDMLLGNQQQLERTLAQAGLTLGKFSVDVSGGNPGFTKQHAQQQQSSGKSGSLHIAAMGEEETWTDPRFGPPVLSGSKPWVLNYLV